MPQLDEVETNVIDLQARIARLRASLVAENAAVATAELEGLRTSLRNLNLIVELNDAADGTLLDNEGIHRTLDEIAAELVHFMQILQVPRRER